MRARLLWEIALVAILAIACTHSHQLCASNTAPFTPAGSLTFCKRYEKFGCCTPEDDFDIEAKYSCLFGKTGSHRRWRKCRSSLKLALCEQCSPFSGHIYAKEHYSKASFPGLCGHTCRKFWRRCRMLLEHLIPPEYEDERSLLINRDSSHKFCDALKPSDSFYCVPSVFHTILFNDKAVAVSGSAKESCMCLEKLATGLNTPVAIANAGDGTNRIFIVNQNGIIQTYYSDGSTQREFFLDIRDKLYYNYSGMDRGIMGLAFHPNFKRNGRFYITYSSAPPTGKFDHTDRLSEFTVSSDDPNKADPTSERILLEADRIKYFHNLVTIFFKDDGYLYIACGEDGDGGVSRVSQKLDSYLGKFLRLDVDGTGWGPFGEYAIPPDNPYINQADALPEIYAIGFRSPWGCGVDPGHPKTGKDKGRIICGEVGESQWEELNVIERKANYGWPSKEGSRCYHRANKEECASIDNDPHYRAPIVEYDHRTAGGLAAVGGKFYTGCQSPSFHRRYFWGDFYNGSIFELRENTETLKLENHVVQLCSEEICPAPLQNTHFGHITTFGKDENGEVYFSAKQAVNLEYKYNLDGEVYRLVDPSTYGKHGSCKHNTVQ